MGPASHGEGLLLTVATSSLGGLTAAALTVHPLLGLLVMPATCCLHRAVHARHFEHTARLDAKTGLLTSAAWHTQAQRALHGRGPGARARAVLVIDLDEFKAVNDTHGHLAGDAVLVAVADALRAEVRDGDLIGRFGGDEFVVLLTGPDEHRDRHDTTGLLTVADRIRSRVAALRVEIPTPHRPATITGLTVSIGGTPLPEEPPELQALFQLADTALYAAKRAGGDTARAMPPAPHLAHRRAAGPADTRHDQPSSEWTARP
jgi:diguanylate cyclase (GGDEF)-like protein